MSKNQKKAVERSHAKVMDYKNTFTTEHGKKVLHDLMNAHGMLSSTYREASHDMAYREGERNVILRIFSILKTDMNVLEQSITEAHDYGRTDYDSD